MEEYRPLRKGEGTKIKGGVNERPKSEKPSFAPPPQNIKNESVIKEKEDKISLTVEQLKRFYLEAYKEGETAKLVCGKMSSKSLNSLEDKDWMTTLIKALNK